MSTILIVEDDVNINEMLKVALQKEGYSCIQAFSGTEGRLVLSQEEPDLVLLDLMLPGMSGETLLEEIRQTKRAVPVIVLPARDEMDSKVDMLLSGADDYVKCWQESRFSFGNAPDRKRKRFWNIMACFWIRRSTRSMWTA